jgi:hypothetical protein
MFSKTLNFSASRTSSLGNDRVFGLLLDVTIKGISRPFVQVAEILIIIWNPSIFPQDTVQRIEYGASISEQSVQVQMLSAASAKLLGNKGKNFKILDVGTGEFFQL